MTTVEKVARALCDGHLWPGAWEKATNTHREEWIGYTRAAIEVMREPSEAMLQAVMSEFSPPGAELVAKGYWTAMISAALEER